MKLTKARTRLEKIIPSTLVDELAHGLIEVERILVHEGVTTDVEPLHEATRSVIQAGGKRLRPVLVLLGGFAGEYRREELATAAAAVEMIHTASLVHDDIIDGSVTRRGRETLQYERGRGFAIAAGDFMFARAFELLATLKKPAVVERMARAAVDLSLGELDGQAMRRDFVVDRERYFRLIERKTASLFAAACAVGGLIADAPAGAVAALETFGWRIGVAFQIYDDILDIVGDEAVLGKPAGSDLKEGIVTLPYVVAVESGALSYADFAPAARSVGGWFDAVIERVRSSGAIEAATTEARNLVSSALASVAALSNSQLREALESIGAFVVERYA